MATEYEKSVTVQASADLVFGFVSDVRNLPKYLPTLQMARPQGQHVHLEGEAAGHHYEGEGNYHADSGARRMEWGSDAPTGYRGWLQVNDSGGNSSEVTIHLTFHSAPPMTQGGAPGGPNPIQDALDQTLDSIRALCETP